MKEIEKYMDILEDRHKAYIRLIEMLIDDNVELTDKVAVLEQRIKALEDK